MAMMRLIANIKASKSKPIRSKRHKRGNYKGEVSIDGYLVVQYIQTEVSMFVQASRP